MWKWLKSKKGTPVFKYLIFIIVLIGVGMSISAYKNYFLYASDNQSKQSDNTQSSANNDAANDAANDKWYSFFKDIHIGWSNIIVFVGLAVALAVIEHKKDKSSESQKMSKFYYDTKEDNTNPK